VNVTEIRVLLNRSAALYAEAKNQNEKREALADYLYFLQILAADKGFSWSAAWSRMKADDGATEELLRAIDPQGELTHCNLLPAMELEEAIRAVNNREHPEIFQPSRKSGKPTSREKVYYWAHAAGLITTLIRRFGKSEQDAAKAVSKAMCERKLPLPGKPTTRTPTWRLLQTWRDKCMAGQKGPLAKYLYWVTVEAAAGMNITAEKLINADTTWNGRPLGVCVPRNAEQVEKIVFRVTPSAGSTQG
jgi:hypothetical protein